VTESGYIKFNCLNVESQEVSIYLDPIGQNGGEIVLEVAEASAQTTSLLLWVNAWKGLLSQHLSMDR
jgi:hypothetical protein